MTETRTLADHCEIVVDETFPHAPAKVWRTLTHGDLIRVWLMEPTGFAPEVGTAFTFQTTPAGAWDGVIHCRVIEVERERRLAYTWASGHASIETGYGSPLDTIVTWTLTPVGQGTRLMLVHSGFVLPRNEGAYTNMSKGWREVVTRISTMSGEA